MPLRGQSSLEYLLLVAGLLALTIIAIVIARTFILAPANQALGKSTGTFGGILKNIRGNVSVFISTLGQSTTVPTATATATATANPTPTPSPGAPGFVGSNSSEFTLFSPAFSGLDSGASSSEFILNQSFIALQPVGVSSSSEFTLRAGPAYAR